MVRSSSTLSEVWVLAFRSQVVYEVDYVEVFTHMPRFFGRCIPHRNELLPARRATDDNGRHGNCRKRTF